MANKPHIRAISAAAAILAVSMAAHAQEQTQQLERIEITGSSIKRFANEGSLPVQIISQEEMKATGATNVADLVQRIPAMQGFTIGDISIGSNSGGIVTASLHGIGESYTLVLVNGRRIAPTGSGSRINLNSIPMAAIERIEVLTDGASALYGSDAIAGVVNFVLKRNQKGGSVNVNYSNPIGNGATAMNASLTYGLGSMEENGFSVVASYRRDDQKRMRSGDRAFSSTAYLPFSVNGKNYVYDRTSNSADPANATVTFKRLAGETTTLGAYSFNPYLQANGKCAPNNFYSLANTIPAGSPSKSGTANCAYDYVSSIDVYPESTRDSFFVSGEAKLNDNFKVFSDVLFTRTDLTARIAANPIPITIATNSALYGKYVDPYLTAAQRSHVDTVTANYRANDFGTRDSQTITDGKHISVGTEGSIGDWDVNGALTWSQNSLNEKYVGGYFKTNEFTSLINSGQVDPFVPSGNQPAAVQQLIDDSVYNGSIRKASTTLKGVNVGASGTVFNLPAGEVKLGTGADFRNYHYKQTPSADAVNGVIYNYAPSPAYDLERNNYGVFAEMVIPVIKDLEANAAVRYDTITKIKDALNARDFGRDESATTYKLSARYKVNKQLLVRGSLGTGFKAPDMLDIAQPLVTNGVTAAGYDCPFPGDGSGAAPCKPGKSQYTQLAGGNENLKPEKSHQQTLGIRFDPTRNFGASIDYWKVKLTDAVSAVSADQAFSDPAKYASLFTTYQLPAENNKYYAFMALSTNIGQSIYKGLDWQVEGRLPVEGLGKLTTTINGTYMIKSEYTMPGTSDVFTSSLGKYGVDASVVFRNIMKATFSLESGKVTNMLRVNYRSGYKDISQTVRDLSTGKNTTVQLDVPEYITFDYQGVYRWSKALELRLGVNNLTNEAPPLTLRSSSGHQVGYDPRYASPLGRTVYVNGNYSF
ncbi:TonB-dependent receptor [Roseateles terrae]|uniref:Iron complex outermembrane receptor protein n=1 Tax=Roseateles terrae TaxID=431060 RepID=A0ABR6GVE3_9BURK|nr:TonB-dependent receptor [Roseateles terrae]MBB3196073.1 iron complex outermembrane receptor protein [Roseateles terrae]OWQ85457.1 TonB-dependent receptor [Roseateles terrae]